MGTNLRLAQAEVRTERRADGSIVLRSPEKLAPYARRVTEWLVQWSDKAPDRIFLAERKGEGWRKLSYREAYGAVPAGAAAKHHHFVLADDRGAPLFFYNVHDL